MKLRFRDLVLDRHAGRLLGPGGEVRLRPQAFRMLVALAEQAPRILSQGELLDRVWGVEHLSPNSVKQAVSEVRQALGDDPARPAVIETVHRRGYRFIAPLEPVEDAPPPAARPDLSALPASLAVLAAQVRRKGFRFVATFSVVRGVERLTIQVQVRDGATVARARESGGLVDLMDLAAAAARGLQRAPAG